MLLLVLFALASAERAKQPNIIWFLTDDQDQKLGASFPPLNGVTPMPKTGKEMADKGATAENFFIHTPICCPSRSELLTGRYFHNIKQVGGKGACMHVNETLVNHNTFAKPLQDAGYTVGMFGKYINNVPNYVPPGFDAWLANGGGNYIAPQFDTFNIDGLPDGSWHGSSENYTTAVVGNTSMYWIRKSVAAEKPFFAYIAPKAAHEPFNPAPWYADHWDPSWPAHEPRPANWNASFESRKEHHGVIATNDLITEEASKVVTDIFKNRWRTLMSVDDVIADVIALCDELGITDNTYFFYSSDHGFQLGEFNILMDKRQPYDTNTHIHLLARGPGIAAGSTWEQPATQVDMAPTFLGLAGLDKLDTMDGKSLLPLLINPKAPRSSLPVSVESHLNSLAPTPQYQAQWRDSVFIEYYFVEPNIKCVAGCKPDMGKYPQQDADCGDLLVHPNRQCWAGACNQNCYPTESLNNNFIVLRSMPKSAFGDSMYAEFQYGNLNQGPVNFDNVNFHELYDAAADPWQINNLYNSTSKDKVASMSKVLHQWYQCQGNNCP